MDALHTHLAATAVQEYDATFAVICVVAAVATLVALLWLAAITAVAENKGVNTAAVSGQDVLHSAQEQLLIGRERVQQGPGLSG